MNGTFTKKRYDEIKKRADSMGIEILTKYRNGCKLLWTWEDEGRDSLRRWEGVGS